MGSLLWGGPHLLPSFFSHFQSLPLHKVSFQLSPINSVTIFHHSPVWCTKLLICPFSLPYKNVLIHCQSPHSLSKESNKLICVQADNGLNERGYQYRHSGENWPNQMLRANAGNSSSLSGKQTLYTLKIRPNGGLLHRAHRALQWTSGLEGWLPKWCNACPKKEGLPQIKRRALNHHLNTEKKINLLEREENLSSLTQCPTEWKTFTLRFHTQVNVPQKPRAVFKNNNISHKPPKNQRHFFTDPFLPSHAHFQSHTGWRKIVHPAKVVFGVYVNAF